MVFAWNNGRLQLKPLVPPAPQYRRQFIEVVDFTHRPDGFVRKAFVAPTGTSGLLPFAGRQKERHAQRLLRLTPRVLVTEHDAIVPPQRRTNQQVAVERFGLMEQRVEAEETAKGVSHQDTNGCPGNAFVHGRSHVIEQRAQKARRATKRYRWKAYARWRRGGRRRQVGRAAAHHGTRIRR